MDRVDAVVIGAGVVGLACARALARTGLDTLVLEQESAFGTATSARNSEVIHAGLYYPTGSLRARLCVQGRQQLYAYCESHGIAHRRCGKLVVACSAEEVPQLQAVQALASANGVRDLQWLSGDQARALEPALVCEAALRSPSTGIIDSHGLMLALLGDAERHGAVLAVQSPVLAGEVTTDGIVLEVGGATPCRLLARQVVNAAGLQACALAGRPASGRAFAGSMRWTTEWTRPMVPVSRPPCATTGPVCPTARCNPAMPACGPRSAGPASRRPTSASTARQTTGWPGW
jgi:L-2-hydroxyglutarate oxidase LhgO